MESEISPSVLSSRLLVESNNLSDFVELNEIILAERTDHDAISLELGKLENELKGPGNSVENELLTVR